jgi:hypothetical protein
MNIDDAFSYAIISLSVPMFAYWSREMLRLVWRT